MVIVGDNFWPEDISPELKNATIKRNFEQQEDSPEFTTYNIACTDNRFSNGFNYNGSMPPYSFIMGDGIVEGARYDICCNE